MNKAIGISLAALLACGALDASAQSNPAPASWQGPRTSGDGVCYLNSGQGVTIQDASKGICAFPLGLNLGQGGTLNISGGSTNHANSKVWTSIGNVTGTYNDPVSHSALFFYYVNQFNVGRAAAGGLRNTMVLTNVGGPQQNGGFINFDSENIVQYPTADVQGSSPSPFFVAGQFASTANANVGGTAPTFASANGANAALNLYATMTSNATNWRGNGGVEVDINAQTGSSVLFGTGVSVVLLSTNTVVPSMESDAFLISSQGSGAVASINCGYCFGGYNGVSAMASTSALMSELGHGGATAYPQMTVQDGIDLHLVAFNGFAFRGSNDTSDIDSSGNFTGRSYTASSATAAFLGGSLLSSSTASPVLIGDTVNGSSLRVVDSASGAIVNIVSVNGGATGQAVGYTCGGPGSDANVICSFTTKGTGPFTFNTGGGKSFQISNAATAADFIQVSGGAAGAPGVVAISASGTDANIDINLVPKGTGVLRVGNTPGVACAAGTVSTTTMVVTGGLVTHC